MTLTLYTSGAPRDYEKAAQWYRLAAEEGNAVAQLNLGHMYAEGLGVSRDDKEAVHWYRLAANRGVAVAQLRALGSRGISRRPRGVTV
jgi:hypothetical protein